MTQKRPAMMDVGQLLASRLLCNGRGCAIKRDCLIRMSTVERGCRSANENPEYVGLSAVSQGHHFRATPPGFEPGMREPKSLVLPVTPRGKSQAFSSYLVSLLLFASPAFLGTVRQPWAVLGSAGHPFVLLL